MAALDAVQLSDGIKFRGQTMVFSWPSKAGFFDYAYDRESAMWSRDDFERVLSVYRGGPGRRTSPHRGAQHGNHADARKPAPALCAIWRRRPRKGSAPWCSPLRTSTWMCSPRRSGASVRSPKKSPSLAATNDRALALSGRLAGGMTRVGAAEKAAIEKLGVRVIDASAAGSGIFQPRCVPVERRSAAGDSPLD